MFGTSSRKLLFETALTADGWQREVLVTVADGHFATVEPGGAADGAERIGGVALPGLPNLHSCVIERALAGLLERDGEAAAAELAARVVAALNPDDVEAIAAQAYAEMLEAGFTAAGEFQTLHLDPNGRPYADVAEINAQVVAAAEQTGIALTLLPVLQVHGGFGPCPATPRQRRFLHDLDGFAELMRATRLTVAFYPGTRLGLAFHSLRTVTIGDIRRLAREAAAGPIHIQLAASDREVAECLAVTGARPASYLLDWVAVDERWCLIHPLQLSAEERLRLAKAGAVAGLCPVAEAHRGEAAFDAVPFLNEGGRIGVGTGSNLCTSPAGLLRTLEYSQRQRNRARPQLVRPDASAGRALFDLARLGGNQALAQPVGGITAGAPADVVVLDTGHPAFAGRSGDRVLDVWVFVAGAAAVRDVWVGGRQLVREGRHRDRDRIRTRFRAAMERLSGRV
ncbi:formimidoylglutamate deiminase [Blastochloris viridis]|uniref:Formiminoglutamic iminohydrolase n=1 Tax=Blastochloris viridis TaxID=1079 RepID=A0A0H5B932_BLAVI|nr:formimidoylglutamate deiminase [Blastochloris viridis]ALK08021.1 8-oxoguanine deaminase [Blastochloris viridis]BAR98720.1 Formiminoglutamic iminohydrolase [Blastochloris viridis]CUU43943.1 N-formimino-L-glutamate deiminase [Blastochloris viridis]